MKQTADPKHDALRWGHKNVRADDYRSFRLDRDRALWAQEARKDFSSLTEQLRERALAQLILPNRQIRTLAAEITMIVAENRAAPENVTIPIVHGPSTAGKTTAVCHMLTDTFHAEYARDSIIEHDGGIRSQRIPIVLASGDNGGARNLMRNLCTFMGIPYATRESAAELRARAFAEMRRCDTQVVVIDDLQSIQAGKDGENTNFLRSFCLRCPATVLLIITNPDRQKHLLTPNLENHSYSEGILARSRQYGFDQTPLAGSQLADWSHTVRIGIAGLPLREMPPKDTIKAIANDTHGRCHGVSGRLLRVLTLAAIAAWRENDGHLTPSLVSEAAVNLGMDRQDLPGSSTILRIPQVPDEPSQ